MLSHDDDDIESLLASLPLAEAAAETNDSFAYVATDEERVQLAAILADLEETPDKIATLSTPAAGALAASKAPAPAGFLAVHAPAAEGEGPVRRPLHCLPR